MPGDTLLTSRGKAACTIAQFAAAARRSGKRFVARDVASPTRWFAIGDPQTTPERFFHVLDREGLLGEGGLLEPEVGLVSMGDHFDFQHQPRELAMVERSGRAILAWLAAHPAGQAVILGGNHDLSRVMELAFETDASFAEARVLALALRDAPEAQKEALEGTFHARHPTIPTPGLARTDYSSFSEAQREVVQSLLLEGRMKLAHTARLRGETALLTHAGITVRELGMLGVPDASPAALAKALNERLALAVAEVTEAWRAGQPAALDLAPVHVAGERRSEGGGLLYHRPARLDREGDVDTTWEADSRRPRRYEPASLPHGLLQVIGHSGHERCVRELATWVHEGAAAARHASVRTLRAGPEAPSYVLGVAPALPHASAVLIDPGLAHAPLETVELLALDDA